MTSPRAVEEAGKRLIALAEQFRRDITEWESGTGLELTDIRIDRTDVRSNADLAAGRRASIVRVTCEARIRREA